MIHTPFCWIQSQTFCEDSLRLGFFFYRQLIPVDMFSENVHAANCILYLTYAANVLVQCRWAYIAMMENCWFPVHSSSTPGRELW
jgi:hypothetical protein